VNELKRACEGVWAKRLQWIQEYGSIVVLPSKAEEEKTDAQKIKILSVDREVE